MKRRAQAALEFLMTYGWAILIMLVVISVLFYLGVFNQSTSTAKSCVLPSGLSCYDFDIGETGSISLDLGQATGKSITVYGVGCGESPAPALTTLPAPVTIQSGRHARVTGPTAGVTINCSGASGSAFKGKIAIKYSTQDSIYNKTVYGDISGPLAGSTTPIPTSCVSGGGLICTETFDGPYAVHAYTYNASPGSTTWNTPAGVTEVEYLVVGGGGAGGWDVGGGGGAGGYRSGTLSVSGSLTVTVGAGGISQIGSPPRSGSNSVFSSITSLGGGGGGGYSGGNGANGGSGGGGSGYNTSGLPGTGTSGQGNNGGAQGAPITTSLTGSGGGGAGGVGATGIQDIYGYAEGGAGISNGITGVAVTYAKGGRGGGDGWGGQANASPNTGNGGDGAGANTPPHNYGRNGSAGIVVIRFLYP